MLQVALILEWLQSLTGNDAPTSLIHLPMRFAGVVNAKLSPFSPPQPSVCSVFRSSCHPIWMIRMKWYARSIRTFHVTGPYPAVIVSYTLETNSVITTFWDAKARQVIRRCFLASQNASCLGSERNVSLLLTAPNIWSYSRDELRLVPLLIYSCCWEHSAIILNKRYIV